jgi:DNA-directed RNA polymerase subunit alpha
VITASDLIYPAEIEIANPELHIATLDNADSRLELELTVEAGKGYLPSDGREPPALGVIPIDAIFSPVRRVNYSVDSTRVGARTDLDRVVIEVSTDGTIKPTDALAQAANLLIQHFGIIADLTRAARPGEKPPLVGTVPSHIAEMPIEQLELSQRTYNCLKRSQITRVGQILERSPDDLLQLRNFGQKSLQELQDKLRQHSLSLTGSDSTAILGTDDEDEELDDLDAVDEESAERLGSSAIADLEEPDDESGLTFGAADFEDEEDEEVSLGQRGSRGRAPRARRGDDDWEGE